MNGNRRDFLRNMALASTAAFAGSAPLAGKLWAGCGTPTFGFGSAAPTQSWTPPVSPAQSGIHHIVVVMMENRSFDHTLGWLPNAAGKQAGLSYTDCLGNVHQTYDLGSDYTGCGHPDPDHSFTGGRIEFDCGKMDGFLRAGSNDIYSIGYYSEHDLQFFPALARNYTSLDHYYASILSATFPNRLFMHAAQTDRLTDSPTLATVPTIWDTLLAHGVSALYYYSNLPFLGLWGGKYLAISRLYEEFLLDAAAGTLPHVAFVDPRYTTIDDGTGNDDHPHADMRAGDAFLAQTFHAVARGPAWPHTVFIVTRDEWGGFFDHVAPYRAAAPNAVDPDVVNGKSLLGLRVPVIVASPWSSGMYTSPRVNHAIYDHTSILKLIEWRWSLPPLTARDASNDIQNLGAALNFASYNPRVPELPNPMASPPMPCFQSSLFGTEWSSLLSSGLLTGWRLPS